MKPVKLREACPLRPIRPLGLWREGPWRLKVYGIAYQRPKPEAELVASARQLVQQHLGSIAPNSNHYCVGFVGIHEGRGANFVFLGWWADENELHQHVYVSSSETGNRWEYRTPSGLVGCVWDLRVMCFEREAWLKWVLRNPAGPSLDDYLAAALSEDS